MKTLTALVQDTCAILDKQPKDPRRPWYRSRAAVVRAAEKALRDDGSPNAPADMVGQLADCAMDYWNGCSLDDGLDITADQWKETKAAACKAMEQRNLKKTNCNEL